MTEKTSTSILLELCTQRKWTPPTFSFEKISDVFVCVAEVFEKTTKGTGRSKADAKHASCSEMIRKCR